VLRKERHGDRDVEVSVPLADLRGRSPVLVDDIISSARTMAEAARSLSRAGGAAPTCVGVHAVFAEGAEETLRSAGVARVVTCNTIEHPTNGIDVLAPYAAAVRSRFLSERP
jgi:ribose-phosphate pyrophosphokinase